MRDGALRTQIGNPIASVNATVQAAIAAHYGADYAFALALVAGIVAIVIAILTAFGPEAHGVAFGSAARRKAPIAGQPHIGAAPVG